MKDELNHSYNGGVVVYVLKSELLRSSLQYIKREKIAKCFYIKSQTLCKKQDNFCCDFYIQKAIYFTLRDFHEILEIGTCIQKL